MRKHGGPDPEVPRPPFCLDPQARSATLRCAQELVKGGNRVSVSPVAEK